MMDELRELRLGIPRRDVDTPRASEQLRAAHEAAMRDDTGKRRFRFGRRGPAS
jgi:hypothetical protein